MQKLAVLHYIPDEELVPQLVEKANLSLEDRTQIHRQAHSMVEGFLKNPPKASVADRLMDQFRLDQPEGVALMGLVEAYMRIPDHNTQNLLIEDKMLSVEMEEVLRSLEGGTGSLIKASVKIGQMFLKNSLTSGVTKPMMRGVINQAVELLAQKYVTSATMEGALKIAKDTPHPYVFSFDMLGEAALTTNDAARYKKAYEKAIVALAQSPEKQKGEISVKLSALHPCYDYAHKERVLSELYDSIKDLCLQAHKNQVNLTIDAEEADRLELSLMLVEKLAKDPDLLGWQGLGLAVQAYQKRATAVLNFLIDLGKENGRCFRVRLVKGAYWDSEIKWAQEKGLDDYPVFTRKAVTDISYLACARLMLAHPQEIFPAFATHNAHTISAILHMAGSHNFEFQCLYGMGTRLYDYLIAQNMINVPVRQYAPVGVYEDLLPYLVRRILENGANSSFLKILHTRFEGGETTIHEIVADPFETVSRMESVRHKAIPLPENLFPERINSKGLDINATHIVEPFREQVKSFRLQAPQDKEVHIHSPIDGTPIGSYTQMDASTLDKILNNATKAFHTWHDTLLEDRATMLEKVADLYEQTLPELVHFLHIEAGKTLNDAISEVREAVDFCRYYAQMARKTLSPQILPGPTGEENILYQSGRGVYVCISPWNFPLAIFTGQIVAALVSGNCVLAKPAGQTVLIAQKAIALMHQAGIPQNVLQLITAPGQVVGDYLLFQKEISGVCMTGSTQTAKRINQILAQRDGPIVPFIAETGGQNAMIVDATALPEQVVKDVLASSFQSAGQRCSALRLLMIQKDIAPKVLEMLQGAMAELNVGDPRELKTSCGPVIDAGAQKALQDHQKLLEEKGQKLFECTIDRAPLKGTYVAPCAYEISDWSLLAQEHFGPILHIMTFEADQLESVMDKINSLGFGLTFGLQSRIQSRIASITNAMSVGNLYVNRNIIGAVVGSQPFGGQGLSGTGPKAGGPHYLLRFVHEKVVTINTTAQGGNATLLMAREE